MASNYPTSLDSFTNPTANDSLNSPSHALQHANANDAIEALEAKLGIGDSTAGSATSGYVLTAGTGGTTTWSAPSIAGMTLLNATTFTTSSGVIVDDVFSSTYDNYRIMLYLTAVSASETDIIIYGRAGGSDTTTNYNTQTIYQNSTSLASVNSSNPRLGVAAGSYPTYFMAAVDLLKPNLASRTVWSSDTFFVNSSGVPYQQRIGGYQDSTTQFTGIKFSALSGTISGTVRIYGYKN